MTEKRSFLTALADGLTFGATRRRRERQAAASPVRGSSRFSGSSRHAADGSISSPDFDDNVPRTWAITPAADSYSGGTCPASSSYGGGD